MGMEYKTLLAKVARRSRQPVEVVRDVLWALPDALITLEEGDHVRTPLGSFRAAVRRSRTYVAPDSDEEVIRGPVILIKMRAGRRLRRPY